jgi:hypothetical protein
MVTFAQVRSSALAINKLCGGLSIEFDFAQARTVAHDQMAEIFQEDLADGSGEAEDEARLGIRDAALWLWAAIVAVLSGPARDETIELVVERTRDYHLAVLRAAVNFNWLPPEPEPD